MMGQTRDEQVVHVDKAGQQKLPETKKKKRHQVHRFAIESFSKAELRKKEVYILDTTENAMKVADRFPNF